MARLASPVVFFTHRSVQTSLERNIFVVVRNLIGVSRTPEPSLRLYPLGIKQLNSASNWPIPRILLDNWDEILE